MTVLFFQQLKNILLLSSLYCLWWEFQSFFFFLSLFFCRKCVTFPGPLSRSFSLSFVFSSLIVICLGKDFFVFKQIFFVFKQRFLCFILLVICWAFWICVLCLLRNLRSFKPLFLLLFFFFLLYSFSVLLGLWRHEYSTFWYCPTSPWSSGHFFSIFCPLCCSNSLVSINHI